ncbi:MAG: tRNA pseudouridine(38-40) synthase TruA [Rhodospirillales bacterium]|nr:tRNA pseudouridine(38-40) synthase TruA [Rhodospirillales bacterium]
MPRYRLTIEYDGSPFVGWQRQDNGRSVQQVLEDALLRFCNERLVVHGAGRTDAGVHAAAQVAHVDLARPAAASTVRDAINFYLKPLPVVVLAAEPCDRTFHARFSAIERKYLYRILNRPAPPALERGRVWWIPKPLDTDAMVRASRVLEGHHDFSTFRSTQCQARTAVKSLSLLDVRRQGDEIHIEARARSFLHNQVRIIAGTLARVGDGKWTADDVAAALAACDRTRGGPTAPPQGLSLAGVGY